MSQTIEVTGSLTVRELAERLSESPISVIKTLMSMGVMASINQTLDTDTIVLVSEEMGHQVVLPSDEPAPVATAPTDGNGTGAESHLKGRKAIYANEPADKLRPRPPVITVLGHVDHGKTTLLDVIREANVVAGEAGGITQHIGAYQVEKQGQLITFIDTPGHAAFTSMRRRGAQGADIAILVVAADDGVMPQTMEAYDHIKAAGVPIVVALNKVDKPNANPDRVKQQLSDIGLIPEEWGGETQVVPMSALRRQGIDDLLDALLIVAEINQGDIVANPGRAAQGVVLESVLDERQGPKATLLVQNGTLKLRDTIVAGTAWGRVRAMFDEKAKPVKEAPPSKPVRLLGLNGTPVAGDVFEVVKDERTARAIVEERMAALERRQGPGKITLEDVYRRLQTADRKDLNIILKADVQGSIEPILTELKKLNSDETSVQVLRAGVGQITESDVALAAASEAVIIGFGVGPDKVARDEAENEGVQIRTYTIIYKLVEDMYKALQGMLEPVYAPVTTGQAEVRQVIRLSRRIVAGCSVTNGVIYRNTQARVIRGRETVYDGTIAALRRFTEDVREVRSGFECGITLDGFDDFREGDIIESYRMERQAVV
jgi:translation initiation factor IF-2